MTVEDSYENFVNVWVVPSAGDYNKTEGLCGVWDGNSDNDLTNPSGTVVVDSSDRPNDYLQTWR